MPLISALLMVHGVKNEGNCEEAQLSYDKRPDLSPDLDVDYSLVQACICFIERNFAELTLIDNIEFFMISAG